MNALWRCAFRVAYFLRLCYGFVLRPPVHGAYVAVWHGDRVLLVRNSYRRSVSFPAGGLRAKETPLDAAVRELREEVGIRVQPSELQLAREVRCWQEFHDNHASVFEIRFDEAPAVNIDDREVVWAEFTAMDELPRERLCPVAKEHLLGGESTGI